MFDFSIGPLALAERIRRREIGPEQVVAHYLARIDQCNPPLNAISFRRDEQVLEEARAQGEKLARVDPSSLPPFFGVPIAIKALTPVKGWPLDLCSNALVGNRAPYNHDSIKALRRAGFLLLCQTTAPELGAIPVTESDRYGATKNPWQHELTPGGSSGGSAVCVAAGMAPIADASDGGGSIRIPASCCGLLGLKPSRGRVWSGPVFCLQEVGTQGCLTRTVADTAAALDVLCSRDPQQWLRAPKTERNFLEEVSIEPGQLRIGYSVNSIFDTRVDAECIAAVTKTACALEELGHTVFEVNYPAELGPAFRKRFRQFWDCTLGAIPVPEPSLLEYQLQYMFEQGRMISGVEFRQGFLELQLISRKLMAPWSEQLDIILTPTLGITPPKIGALIADKPHPEELVNRCFEMAPFTAFFNVSGQPAISIPMHQTAEGIPIGVQLAAPLWDETTLLRLSAQLERTYGWSVPQAKA